MFWNARDLWREMIQMIHDVGWTTYYRGWPTDYGRWPIYVGRWPSFLHINKGSLNPFKYLEMIKNYEGKMIDEVKRMEGTYRLQRMTDRLRKMTLHPIILIYNYLSSSLYSYHHFRTFRWPCYFEDENYHFRIFKCIQTILVNLKETTNFGASSNISRSSSVVCRSSSVVCSPTY